MSLIRTDTTLDQRRQGGTFGVYMLTITGVKKNKFKNNFVSNEKTEKKVTGSAKISGNRCASFSFSLFSFSLSSHLYFSSHVCLSFFSS